MKIEITGNPGTGNTFSEVHIGYVNNYNPNATTVVQNYYDGKQPASGNPPREVAESNQHNAKSQPLSEEQRSQLRKQIKDYVNQLSPNYVTADWRDRYDQLWDAIIDLPEVSAKIYDHGHQDWPFNGYLTQLSQVNFWRSNSAYSCTNMACRCEFPQIAARISSL